MDINTKIAIQRGWIPSRYRNQLDTTRTISENYISERERLYELIMGNQDDEETSVTINATYKEI